MPRREQAWLLHAALCMQAQACCVTQPTLLLLILWRRAQGLCRRWRLPNHSGSLAKRLLICNGTGGFESASSIPGGLLATWLPAELSCAGQRDGLAGPCCWPGSCRCPGPLLALQPLNGLLHVLVVGHQPWSRQPCQSVCLLVKHCCSSMPAERSCRHQKKAFDGQ